MFTLWRLPLLFFCIAPSQALLFAAVFHTVLSEWTVCFLLCCVAGIMTELSCSELIPLALQHLSWPRCVDSFVLGMLVAQSATLYMDALEHEQE